jgi:tRNA (guanine-N7-)-methyltransferase
MRMRKKKNGAERLSACGEFIYKHEGEPLTDPAAALGMTGAPVYLEIGAGKGGFACGMARVHADTAYFAMERVSDCAMLAAERAKREGNLDNLRFVIDTADNLTSLFGSGSVDAIFLNFSDPWSKKGYAKRRLTHRRYLSVYFNLLKDGGVLRFKTDNIGLFDFSLEEILAMGLECSKCTRDLHASEFNDGNIMTEYETAFSSEGIKINMLEVIKPCGFKPEMSKELLPGGKEFFIGTGTDDKA